MDGAVYTYLVKSAHRRQEDDSIRIIKVRNPLVSLAARAADVVEVPDDALAGDLHHELVRRDAHRLQARAQDVVCRGRVVRCGDAVDALHEADFLFKKKVISWSREGRIKEWVHTVLRSPADGACVYR